MAKNRKTTQDETTPQGKLSVTAVPNDEPVVAPVKEPVPVNSFRVRNNTNQKLVVSVNMTQHETRSVELLARETVMVKGTYADKYVKRSLSIYGGKLSLVE